MKLVDEDGEEWFSEEEEKFLHIDVFDTNRKDFDSFLFELIFFFGFYDPLIGSTIMFDPSRTNFRIELATGPLAKRLAVPFFGAIERVVPSNSTFESSKKGLLRGMGKLRFYGRRYDGTSMRKADEGIRHASAYERLQYVCTALSILDQLQGRFPYLYEGNVAEKTGILESLRVSLSLSLSHSETDDYSADVPGEKCLSLIVKYSKMKKNKLSLWCVWNFVNMVYWQLRDMHYPDSPLNTACMPEQQDGEKREDADAKELIKGILVDFILKVCFSFFLSSFLEFSSNLSI